MNTPDNDPRKAQPVTVIRNSGVDSALPPDADPEERFNQFWRENGTSIFSSIAIGAAIVIGMQIWRYIEARAEKHTQESYLAAGNSAEALVSFASEKGKHPLAGASYMQLATAEFARGEYIQAAEHYALAADILSGSAFAERARLGMAMSELMSGKVDSGLESLRAIMDNPDYTELTRAEAPTTWPSTTTRQATMPPWRKYSP
jgi:predicted negative regulator of RcsB-dependent stress response